MVVVGGCLQVEGSNRNPFVFQATIRCRVKFYGITERNGNP